MLLLWHCKFTNGFDYEMVLCETNDKGNKYGAST